MGLLHIAVVSVCCDEDRLSSIDNGTMDNTGMAVAIAVEVTAVMRDGDEDRLLGRLVFGVADAEDDVDDRRMLDILRNKLPIFPLDGGRPVV